MFESGKHVLLVAAGALLAGCVSTYKLSATAENSASLTLVRGASHLGAKSLQEYEAYHDAVCTPSRGTGRLAALLTYAFQSKNIQVNSGQPLYVLARTSLYDTAPRKPGDDINVSFYMTTDSCSNLVSFTPSASRQYKISQDVSASGCSVSVVDRTTGAPPVDLKVEDARACPVPKS